MRTWANIYSAAPAGSPQAGERAGLPAGPPPHSVQFRTSSRSKCIFRATVACRNYCTKAFADSPRTRYKCFFFATDYLAGHD
ncbi:hypothetical protein Y032_0101g3364 [Ancylostoma ceylanicum]|uniref:Uncharacterized protein n=1 Tax=Ancylostoma ceylanicum TaxID=53326 RepID=A0A016THS3_9BILA|nr:hypothetical protein Y032_0101g3364 [Ancylostoma ceylanicum]